MTKYYITSKLATYRYMVLLRDMKHYAQGNTYVDVIGETDKSYVIKAKTPFLNHKVDDILFVRKNKIRLTANETERWNDYWYNKI